MNIKQYLSDATQQLVSCGIGTARLDALVLLEDTTKLDRAQLLAEPAMELSSAQLAKLTKLLNRRVQHEPLAYIRGQAEFYGRTFVLTPAVLQPRPESETMVELLKTLPLAALAKAKTDSKLRIADIGAGSGAIGITAKLELSKTVNTNIELLEVDPKALKVAKINVDKFTLKIKVTKSDLLTRSSQQNDVLLCNLPYVPDDFHINTAALHEPRLAIFGGHEGLDIYRKLFRQIIKLPKKPLYILTEALPPQHPKLKQIASSSGYYLRQTNDFIQLFELSTYSA